MDRLVFPRQILAGLLLDSQWQTIYLSELVKRVKDVCEELKSRGIPSSLEIHRTNSGRYWSDDVNYEVGLLGTMGLLRMNANLVEKADRDYEEDFKLFCAGLQPEVQEAIRTAVQ